MRSLPGLKAGIPRKNALKGERAFVSFPSGSLSRRRGVRTRSRDVEWELSQLATRSDIS